MGHIGRTALGLLAALLAAGTVAAAPPPAEGGGVTPADAAFHRGLLVLDTHLDTPMHFGRLGWDFAARHSYADDATQVDLPRMADGGLDGGFFVIYTPQGPLTAQGYAAALAHALRREANIRLTVSRHPEALELATTAADAGRIAAAGRRVVYQSIENSYPLGDDLRLLDAFHTLGVRMAGPVHFLNNQFADSATDTPKWNGLSPLGRRWVAEMNRLGMVIDASHASDAAFDQMLALSKAPIILSHSGPRAIYDHPRNIDDARLRALAAKGGVIQINSVYLRANPKSSPERDAVMDRIDTIEDLSPEAQQALLAERRAMNRAQQAARATFDDFMASLLHALKLVGPQHVGIGADWDGGGGVAGMEDVAQLPRITAALRRAGYGDAAIADIWSGNMLRVLAANERLRR